MDAKMENGAGDKVLEKEESMTTQINSFELDALKETANIGTGNASIALSNIFKKKVNITLPDLHVAKSSEVSGFIAGPKEMVVGVFSRIRDGMDGNIIMVMPIRAAQDISKTFMPNRSEDSDALTDDDKLLLRRVGIATYSSYLTSLAKFFETKITFAPPNIFSTFGDSILDFIMLNVSAPDDVLVIKLGYDIEETEIKGEFILLFTTNSLSPLLENIRRKMGAA